MRSRSGIQDKPYCTSQLPTLVAHYDYISATLTMCYMGADSAHSIALRQ